MKARVASVCLLATLICSPAADAGEMAGAGPWVFWSRGFIAGNSASSRPDGYVMYSPIGLEVELERGIGARTALALAVRTESREMDFEPEGASRERLGSLELLPMTLLVEYRPRPGGRVRPVLGIGANLTVAWEKSGALDTLDVRPHFGPAVRLGAEMVLRPGILAGLDLRWNTLTSDIRNGDAEYAEVKIDPISIGLGVGFRF